MRMEFQNEQSQEFPDRDTVDITGHGSAAETPLPSKIEVLSYFENILAWDSVDIGEYYAILPEYDFDHSDLTYILQQTRKIYRSNELPDKAYDFLRSHAAFDTWFDCLGKTRQLPKKLIKNFSDFSQMMIIPKQNFLNSISSIDLDDLRPNSLEDFMTAHARLGKVPERSVLEKWVKAAGNQLHCFKAEELVMSIWSFAVFKAISNNPELDAVAKILLRKTENLFIGAKLITPINAASYIFDLPHYRKPALQRDDDFAASRLERTLSLIFKEAGLLVAEKDHFIPEFGTKVDLRLKHQNADILLEVDGYYHYVRNLNDPTERNSNGSTHLQTALLEILYPHSTIIRLDDKGLEDFDLATDPHACLNYSLSLIEEFPNLQQGAYKTTVEDGTVKINPFFSFLYSGPA